MYADLHVKYPLFLLGFNEASTFSADFRKILKFHENPSSGKRVISCGRTDRRDEANNRFSQFWERT